MENIIKQDTLDNEKWLIKLLGAYLIHDIVQYRHPKTEWTRVIKNHTWNMANEYRIVIPRLFYLRYDDTFDSYEVTSQDDKLAIKTIEVLE